MHFQSWYPNSWSLQEKLNFELRPYEIWMIFSCSEKDCICTVGLRHPGSICIFGKDHFQTYSSCYSFPAWVNVPTWNLRTIGRLQYDAEVFFLDLSSGRRESRKPFKSILVFHRMVICEKANIFAWLQVLCSHLCKADSLSCAKSLSAINWSVITCIYGFHCSVDGELVPREGDEVTYKLCSMPPKFEKFCAVHVVIVNPRSDLPHERWSAGPHHNCSPSHS